MPSEEQTLSDAERWYTPEEVAARFKMTVKQVHAEVRAGRLGYQKISARKRRFHERHLRAYEALTECPATTADATPQRSQKQSVPRAGKLIDNRPRRAVLSPVPTETSKGGDCSEQSLKSPDFSRASTMEEMKQWR